MTATAASPSCPRPGRLLLTSAVFMAALYAVGVASGALGASLTREGSVGRSDTPAGVVDLFLHNSLVLALLGIGIVTAGLATGAQMLLNGTVLGMTPAFQSISGTLVWLDARRQRRRDIQATHARGERDVATAG